MSVVWCRQKGRVQYGQVAALRTTLFHRTSFLMFPLQRPMLYITLMNVSISTGSPLSTVGL
jgi:hypothetical protein